MAAQVTAGHKREIKKLEKEDDITVPKEVGFAKLSKTNYLVVELEACFGGNFQVGSIFVDGEVRGTTDIAALKAVTGVEDLATAMMASADFTAEGEPKRMPDGSLQIDVKRADGNRPIGCAALWFEKAEIISISDVRENYFSSVFEGSQNGIQWRGFVGRRGELEAFGTAPAAVLLQQCTKAFMNDNKEVDLDDDVRGAIMKAVEQISERGEIPLAVGRMKSSDEIKEFKNGSFVGIIGLRASCDTDTRAALKQYQESMHTVVFVSPYSKDSTRTLAGKLSLSATVEIADAKADSVDELPDGDWIAVSGCSAEDVRGVVSALLLKQRRVCLWGVSLLTVGAVQERDVIAIACKRTVSDVKQHASIVLAKDSLAGFIKVYDGSVQGVLKPNDGCCTLM